MKRSKTQRYRRIPETAEEHSRMAGYNEGFHDGYTQAMFDRLPEDEKEIISKTEDTILNDFIKNKDFK